MFLLRLTSDDSLHGMETDDGFIIGSLTGDTIFLVVATTALGGLGGLIYVGMREWFPNGGRPVLFGLLAATAGGALIIRPGGIDFSVLEPLWLAVAMFVLIPAAYGVSLSVLTERLVRWRGFRFSRWRWAAVAVLLPVALTGPVGIAFLLILALGIAANRSGQVGRLWRSTPATWTGRLTFVALLLASGVFLLKDALAVL
jgi:hypothetical protein